MPGALPPLPPSRCYRKYCRASALTRCWNSGDVILALGMKKGLSITCAGAGTPEGCWAEAIGSCASLAACRQPQRPLQPLPNHPHRLQLRRCFRCCTPPPTWLGIRTLNTCPVVPFTHYLGSHPHPTATHNATHPQVELIHVAEKVLDNLVAAPVVQQQELGVRSGGEGGDLWKGQFAANAVL